MVSALGSKTCDELLSSDSFNFNLRRYRSGAVGSQACAACPVGTTTLALGSMVGRLSRTSTRLTWNRPTESTPCEHSPRRYIMRVCPISDRVLVLNDPLVRPLPRACAPLASTSTPFRRTAPPTSASRASCSWAARAAAEATLPRPSSPRSRGSGALSPTPPAGMA